MLLRLEKLSDPFSHGMSWNWITPYILTDPGALDPEARLRAPSAGLIHHLSEDIVVKLNFQYCVPTHYYPDRSEATFYRECSFASFRRLANEAEFYQIVDHKPHRNILRSVHCTPGKALFLPRIERTLASAARDADRATRYQWVRELLSALSWIESLGFVHGDLGVRSILVDRSGHLQLINFDRVVSLTSPDIAGVKERDHRALATCLHFILSGVDLTDDYKPSWENEKRLRRGEGQVTPAAAILGDIISAGWLGRDAHRTMFEVERDAIEIIGAAPASFEERGGKSRCAYSGERLHELQRACQAWAAETTMDLRWQEMEQHRAAWKAVGLDPDEDE